MRDFGHLLYTVYVIAPLTAQFLHSDNKYKITNSVVFHTFVYCQLLDVPVISNARIRLQKF